MIRLNEISVTYPNGHIALQGITADINKGSICGLVGLNGAGKSTLFKTIMGQIKPDNGGKISINGNSVKSALKNNNISYVPQAENVDWNFPLLVKDLVMMGRYSKMGFTRKAKKLDYQAVDAALKKVGMLDFKHRQIGELSGGQKKRIFVARALAQGGNIILLDEPFAGVDLKTELSLIELFKDLSHEGKLILVSTHNLGSVPDFCDEVLLINKSLIAFGDVTSTYTQRNLSRTFGGMLRHNELTSDELHKDQDSREVVVLTDDERPLVIYGSGLDKKIITSKQ